MKLYDEGEGWQAAGYLTGALLFVAAFLAVVFGYINNIVLLANSDDFTIRVMLRIVGMFIPPLGILMGYL